MKKGWRQVLKKREEWRQVREKQVGWSQGSESDGADATRGVKLSSSASRFYKLNIYIYTPGLTVEIYRT